MHGHAKYPPPTVMPGSVSRTPCPSGSLIAVPTVVTPYPYFQPLPGQEAPPDPLGCYGPDFSFVQKQILKQVLGSPRGSDPADPYSCSGSYVLPVALGNGFIGFFRRHSKHPRKFSLYTNGKLTYRGK